MNKSEATSVLIVEDEPIVGLHLRTELETYGYEVRSVVARSDDVISEVQAKRPSLVLMDIRLKGAVDGVTLAEELFVCEGTPVVFLSAYFDADIIRRAAHSGAYGYLTKPVTPAALFSTIELAVRKHRELQARTGNSQWLSVALDALDAAVIGLDRDARVRFMNAAAVRLTGLHLVEAMQAAPSWLNELAASSLEPNVERTVTLRFRDGEPVSASVRRLPVRDGGSLNLVRVV